jgi:hypothetical protein
MLEQNNFTGANNSPGRRISMKTRNTFTLKNIVLNIEGNPIELGDINFENEIECSVQELAQSGSFVKDIIYQIRDAIKEAQASAQQVYDQPRREIEDVEAVSEQNWNLPTIWSVMMRTLPEGFEKTGIGVYTYKYEKEDADGKNKKTSIRISFNDTIDMRIYVGDTKASFYLYEDAERSWVDGINSTLISELISELPEGVREFVRNFVKKVLNK